MVITRGRLRLSEGSVDNGALAVLLIGGLINVRRSTWSFGAPPLGVNDERVIDTFIALTSVLMTDPASPASAPTSPGR